MSANYIHGLLNQVVDMTRNQDIVDRTLTAEEEAFLEVLREMGGDPPDEPPLDEYYWGYEEEITGYDVSRFLSEGIAFNWTKDGF